MRLHDDQRTHDWVCHDDLKTIVCTQCGVEAITMTGPCPARTDDPFALGGRLDDPDL